MGQRSQSVMPVALLLSARCGHKQRGYLERVSERNPRERYIHIIELTSGLLFDLRRDILDLYWERSNLFPSRILVPRFPQGERDFTDS